MLGIKNIILGVTASVAIYKSCDLLRCLKEEKFLVSVVMTKESQELIKPKLFESLSLNKVYCGLFDESSSWEIEHVSLADKADLILIAPATANIIGKIAGGICDDLLTCIVMASKAPVLICPAMNDVMYKNVITQTNIAKLKKCGYKFLAPVEGKLACGKMGIGCFVSIEEIVKEVKKEVL
ncbi:MAG: flavoprotein [Candidatus Omnitrophota bacterium]